MDLHGALEDPEDYEYLAIVGSRLLATAGYQFDIGGFGHDDWNFDVEYDMSALIEDLPSLLHRLRTGETSEIDLYSQGVERELKFTRSGGVVRIDCVSRTQWIPNPDVETCDYAELEKMLTRLAADFAHGLHRLSSPIAQLDPFSKWLIGDV